MACLSALATGARPLPLREKEASHCSVQPDLDVLSNDTSFARSKRKVREPDAAEMARWRLVAVTPETGGTLPIGPDGALNALVESEPTALPQVEIDVPVPTHGESQQRFNRIATLKSC